MAKKLSTNPYRGVRDFYPEDMAIQKYIFSVWSKTAEAFGYECYDASILEPAELYTSKGAENEEMAREQTYTFTDRGDRTITLRPEMTPTVARMVAGKAKELASPIRWYSIPNLFRYERTQRGRLREHWQLNCDVFGIDDPAADIELISLAYKILIAFGATPEMFQIRVNNRQTMKMEYEKLGIKDEATVNAITRLNDRKQKITADEYQEQLVAIVTDNNLAEQITQMIENPTEDSDLVVNGLRALGIDNVVIDRSLARGFDYYTGTIFEIFDTSSAGSGRSMLGGGRYDNLTALFSDEKISGVGFGMGDVTMCDFLETHELLPSEVTNTAPTITIIPQEETFNTEAMKVADLLRQGELSADIDFSTRKRDKKFSRAKKRGVQYVIIVGENEQTSNRYTLQNLATTEETHGTLDELISALN